MKSLPGFLSESHRVDANILIIEGWLPDVALEMTKREIDKDVYDIIFTTGVRSSELDFCLVAMNGYLIFYPEFPSDADENYENHLIGITARSKMGGVYCSHFNFYLNDSLMADFDADDKAGKYYLNWFGSLNDIDSMMVQFTNDMVDENGDRNLYVREITIDNKIIIPYQYNSVLDIGSIGGSDRIVNNYESHPQIIRNKLISRGLDSTKIVAVPAKKTHFNRTLTSALALKRCLKASGKNIKGINIISMGIHSRRTWLTYKRILDKSYQIGIISLSDSTISEYGTSEVLKNLGEALELVYYWIILLPFLF